MPATPHKAPPPASAAPPPNTQVPAGTQPNTPATLKKTKNKGLWKDGHWWCNCDPPQKATLREVKKGGKNAGKFFWTCDTYPFCDFFLWYDHAKAREIPPAPPEMASRPAWTQQPLTRFGIQVTPRHHDAEAEEIDLTDSDADIPAVESPSAGPSKRKRAAEEVESRPAAANDADEFSDLDSDQEREMVAIADAATPSTTTTPSTTRVIAGLPTPSVARTLFPADSTTTPDAKRRKTVSFDTPSSSKTLTPGTGAASPEQDLDIAAPVMALLRDQPLDSSVSAQVQALLDTADRRARGLVLGRESARAGVRARDARIAALQERVAALENRERMHHSRVTGIKASLMKMYEET